MSDIDPTRLLFQLDTASALALFWYVLLFDLPRYTLFGVASELLRECQPPGGGYARPLVSVVLAGHDEKKVVRRCVQSLRQQTYDRLEIICVDDGSSDGMDRELRRAR